MLKSVRRLESGRSHFLSRKNIELIANYSEVSFVWLVGKIKGPWRNVSTFDVSKDAPLLAVYPPLSDLNERLDWAAMQSAWNKPAVLELAGTILRTGRIREDNAAANLLGRHLRVHASWLQGADVNVAKASLPAALSDKSIRSYLERLRKGGYPFNKFFYNKQTQNPLARRINFAVVCCELETGLRVDASEIARQAGVDSEIIHRSLQSGSLQVRMAERIGSALSVNGLWLLTGEGSIKTGHIDGNDYFDLLKDSPCQGERLDLAKLVFDQREGVVDSWTSIGSRLGLSPTAMSLYRSCKRRIPGVQAIKLAEHFGVDPTWIQGTPTSLGQPWACPKCARANKLALSCPNADLTNIAGRIAFAKDALDKNRGRVVTWSEIAKRAGLDRAWFSMYAQGRRNVTWNACQILATALEVDLHWLWKGPSDAGELLGAQYEAPLAHPRGDPTCNQNLRELSTLLERINWALTSAGYRIVDTPTYIQAAVRNLATGICNSIDDSLIRWFVSHCAVPYSWLIGNTAITPKPPAILLPQRYPALVSVIERIEWAAANCVQTWRIRAELEYVRKDPDRIKLDDSTANRLATVMGVHSAWLQGANVDDAKEKATKKTDSKSIRSYLSKLIGIGYPIDRVLFDLSDNSPLALRMCYAIVLYELKNGQRTNFTALARMANIDHIELRACLSNGELRVRQAVRLARALGVNVKWLQFDMEAATHCDNWTSYFSLFKESCCPGDRFEISKLRMEQERGESITFLQLSSETGIRAEYLSYHRNCRSRVSFKQSQKLASVLNVDPYWLFGSGTCSRCQGNAGTSVA